MQLKENPPRPDDVTQFEDCIKHTDKAIEKNPKSAEARQWVQQLVKIAEDRKQPQKDQDHRPFEAYYRWAQLRDQNGMPTDESRRQADVMVHIADNEKDPKDKAHRLREAWRTQVEVQQGALLTEAVRNFKAVTRPEAINPAFDPDAPQWWAFMRNHVLSKADLDRTQRIKYALRAEKRAAEAADPWKIGESKKVLDSLQITRGDRHKAQVIQTIKKPLKSVIQSIKGR